MFYRNLFRISVRATEPLNAQTPDGFNALVDRAVQDLVPAMDIQNFGQCGSVSVSVDSKSTDKDKQTKEMSLQLVREVGRLQRESCASAPDPKTTPPAGHQQQTIVYPANFWQ